jgi:hypothetical protein
LRRKVFQSPSYRCAAGRKQGDLMRLQVTERSGDHLVSGQLTLLVGQQQ